MGLILMLSGAIPLLKYKFDNVYLKILFSLYITWFIYIVIRIESIDYTLFKWLLFDAWGGILLYFVPLVVLFPKNLFYYKRIFDVVFVLNISFLILTLLFAKAIFFTDQEDLTSRGIVEVFTKTLAVPTFFTILTFIYHPKKRLIVSVLSVLLTILLALVKARRGLLLMSVIPMVFVYFLYLFESKAKVLVIVLSMMACSVLLVYGLSIYEESSLFSYIKERGLEDTRSKVEICYFEDMTPRDLWIGKGIFGVYFCPGIDPDDKTGYRTVIETDYLQIILKGGIISLGLLLLIAIPAAFLGIFASKNLLSKAAGIWIILALINMYPSTVNTFTYNYLLVWMSIGIGYSKSIRQLPDEVLKLYFNQK